MPEAVPFDILTWIPYLLSRILLGIYLLHHKTVPAKPWICSFKKCKFVEKKMKLCPRVLNSQLYSIVSQWWIWQLEFCCCGDQGWQLLTRDAPFLPSLHFLWTITEVLSPWDHAHSWSLSAVHNSKWPGCSHGSPGSYRGWFYTQILIKLADGNSSCNVQQERICWNVTLCQILKSV